jgi:hypothetical protein
MVYLIDTLFSLLLLAIGVFTVTIVFTNSLNIGNNMAEAAIISIVSIVVWVLYYQDK